MDQYSNHQINQIRSQVKSQLYKGIEKTVLNKEDIILTSIIANYLQKLGLVATLNTLQSECELIPTSQDLSDIYKEYKTSYTVNYDIQHLEQYYQSLLKDVENKHSLELLKNQEYYKQLQYKLQREHDNYKQLYKQQPQNQYLLENIHQELLEVKSSVLELQMKKDPYLYELEHIKQLLSNSQQLASYPPQTFQQQNSKLQHTLQMNELLKQQLDQQVLATKELQREIADLRYLEVNQVNAPLQQYELNHLPSDGRTNSAKSDLSQNELKLLRKKSLEGKSSKNLAYDLSSAELKLLKKESVEPESREGVSVDISTQELKLLNQNRKEMPHNPLKSNSSRNVSFSTNDQQLGEHQEQKGKHVVISAVDEQIDDIGHPLPIQQQNNIEIQSPVTQHELKEPLIIHDDVIKKEVFVR
eukprot:NODE_67_length_23829_cov_0.557059.p5 type:complete len:415 gc:universal NODE_67_length_23829_cov_0.557059:17568-16324(-)